MPKVKVPAFFVFSPAGVQAAPAEPAGELDAVAVAALDPAGVVVVAPAVVPAELPAGTEDAASVAADEVTVDEVTVDEVTVPLEPFEEEQAAIDVTATLTSTRRANAAVRAGLCTQKG